MHSANQDLEVLDTALDALRQGESFESILDRLPAPIYVTDAEGVVTYFNPACVGFAGRQPQRGKDRWCVTWKLYTDRGEFLPHERCPMARAIHEKQPVRGIWAVAERPDGTRVKFLPYPTPLFAADGTLTGAVNMLIDITEEKQLEELRAQAARCLRLADCTTDAQISANFLAMAAEYDEAAALLANARARTASKR
jgi:PAS domain S-box-containing protein